MIVQNKQVKNHIKASVKFYSENKVEDTPL